MSGINFDADNKNKLEDICRENDKLKIEAKENRVEYENLQVEYKTLKQTKDKLEIECKSYRTYTEYSQLQINDMQVKLDIKDYCYEHYKHILKEYGRVSLLYTQLSDAHKQCS